MPGMNITAQNHLEFTLTGIPIRSIINCKKKSTKMNQNRDQKNLMDYFKGIKKTFIRVGNRLIIKGSVVLPKRSLRESPSGPTVKSWIHFVFGIFFIFTKNNELVSPSCCEKMEGLTIFQLRTSKSGIKINIDFKKQFLP